MRHVNGIEQAAERDRLDMSRLNPRQLAALLLVEAGTHPRESVALDALDAAIREQPGISDPEGEFDAANVPDRFND